MKVQQGIEYMVNRDITWQDMSGTDTRFHVNNPAAIALDEGQVVMVESVNYPTHLRVSPEMDVEVRVHGGEDLWLICSDWLRPIPAIFGDKVMQTIVVHIVAGSPLALREGGLETGWYWWKGYRSGHDQPVDGTTTLHGAYATRRQAEVDAADWDIRQQLIAQELTADMRRMPRWSNTQPAALSSFWNAIIWHDNHYWAIARGYQFRKGTLLQSESSTSIGSNWHDAQHWIESMYGEVKAEDVRPLR